MREMVYKCDKCGRKITEDENLYSARITNMKRFPTFIIYGDTTKSYDLCEQCTNNLLKVDKPVKEEPDQIHTTNKGDHKVIYDGRQVDLGKIFALKKAGWSNTKIADELGISSNTLGSTIYRNKANYEAFLSGKWDVQEENEFSY